MSLRQPPSGTPSHHRSYRSCILHGQASHRTLSIWPAVEEGVPVEIAGDLVVGDSLLQLETLHELPHRGFSALDEALEPVMPPLSKVGGTR